MRAGKGSFVREGGEDGELEKLNLAMRHSNSPLLQRSWEIIMHICRKVNFRPSLLRQRILLGETAPTFYHEVSAILALTVGGGLVKV